LAPRSTVDLRRCGAARYAEDPTTEILCLSFRIGDGPVRRWVPGGYEITELYAHVKAGITLAAHNAGFERLIWNAKMPSAPKIEPAQQDCTMARANALALPASLDGVGEALRAPVKKDKAGHALMMQMCKPRTLEPLTWWEDADRMERLQAYCDQDVLSECAIDKLLPSLSDSERKLWVLDQTINDRGFAVDVPAIRAAMAAVEEAKRRADRRMWELTDGAVRKCTEAVKIVAWLNSRGVVCESIAEGEHDELITRTDLMGDPTAAEVINLRQASAKTFKFQAYLNMVCADGRVRGSLAFNTTLSGRWNGRIVQPQNMKRVETEEDEQTVADAVSLLTRPMSPEGIASALELVCGPPLEALSICARAMIVAPPGKKLVGGDFSNIEGRGNAWLAGEAWKVQAFRDYDAGTGPDLYKVMAGSILDKEIDAITKDDRQLWGKVPELACGYQGGVNAFHKMGANYGVRVEDKTARRIVGGWRESNPMIVASWRELQDAAIEAVASKGVIVPAMNGRIQYRCANGFLFCCLPSGRVLAYPSPTVERKSKIVIIDGEEVEFNRWGVSYWGTKKGWRKLDLYGGAQCAHVVSGIARDILAESMHRVEAAGYPLVLTVHDENLAEVDEGFGSADEFAAIMAQPLAWTTGLPVTAKGWEDRRYVK
jgi:DNA polymerase